MHGLMQNILEDNSNIITADLAGAEDLDVPRAIIDFKTAESVYRTALSVGADHARKGLAGGLCLHLGIAGRHG